MSTSSLGSSHTREWRKRQRDANPERYKELRRKWEANEKARDPERYMKRRRDASWRAAIRSLYKLTPEMWQEMYDEQDGKCAVCDLPFGDERPAVDHNHTTNEVRGLVHRTPCNIIVGYVEKYPQIVELAKTYLK